MSRKRRDAEHEFLTDDEFRAWHGSVRFVAAATRAVDEALLAGHGVSINEFDVLITLYNAPGRRLRMTELAQRVLLTPSGLSHLVHAPRREGLRRAHCRSRRPTELLRRAHPRATGNFVGAG